MAFFNYVPDINIFCNPSIVNSHRIHEKPKKNSLHKYYTYEKGITPNRVEAYIFLLFFFC